MLGTDELPIAGICFGRKRESIGTDELAECSWRNALGTIIHDV